MTSVEKFGTCPYEYILMDCNMPVMDGYVATAKIREYLFNKKLR
jgi:CheY-like chemotaxis protein